MPSKQDIGGDLHLQQNTVNRPYTVFSNHVQSNGKADLMERAIYQCLHVQDFNHLIENYTV